MGRQLEELSRQEKNDLIMEIESKKNGVSDKDWAELCDEYDLGVKPDTLRKAGVGVKLVSDAGMLNTGTPANEDPSDGYVERQKLRDLTGKVNALYRSEARSELLRETIKEAIGHLPRITYNVVSWSPVEENGSELVLCLGDFHYGAKIECKGLMGETLNSYNSDVFHQRMKLLIAEVGQIAAWHNVSKINVLLVGDLLDGMLRQSQLMKLEYGLIESTMRLAEEMAQWLDNLSDFCPVEVWSCSGNHSEIRPLKAQHREFEDENLEKIVMWYVKERLRDSMKIIVHDECGRMTLAKICGKTFLLLHGDGVKNINQLAQDAVNLYGQPVDFFVCGHKHAEMEMPSGATSDGHSVIIRVPSVCGIDRFAQSLGYGGDAGAVAMIMEPGYGRRCVYPIKL